ncbi:reverse transcriptase domain-containing protein, partial [Tanacetum coccineum]
AALTWWNGQIRTLGPEAYAMTWEVLKKKMTDKYCPQGEIKKLEIELWNLKVKGNDVLAYTEYHPFNLDLIHVELGSFDVIVGIDWLRRSHAVIMCGEKLVQVPYVNETLTFCGNKSSNRRESWLTVISCSKAQEYMAKGCRVFLAQISAKKEDDKSEGQQIKDVPIIRDFLEVFLEDLPGLPSA